VTEEEEATEHGEAMFRHACGMGLEGIVSNLEAVENLAPLSSRTDQPKR
jgi:ATP-dependent DNA ligase